MPAWVDQAWTEYSRRLPRELSLELREIPLARRSRNTPAAKARTAEGAKLLAAIPSGHRTIALDERGRQWSTQDLAGRLEDWMRERSSPITHLKQLIDDWPDISDDLMALPGVLHAVIREQERKRRQPARADTRPRRHAYASLRRMLAAAAFLIAGILWAGFDFTPVAIGYVAAAVGAAGLLIGAARH